MRRMIARHAGWIFALWACVPGPPHLAAQDKAAISPCPPSRYAISSPTYQVVNIFNALTADSASTPIRSLAGPNTSLCSPRDLATDDAGRLYVMSRHVVTVYQRGASEDGMPIRSIAVADVGSNGALGMDVDRQGNVYVVGDGGVRVFAPTTDEDGPPIRVINGPATTLDQIRDVVVDSRGDIYVVSQGTSWRDVGPSVSVFRPDAEGNAAPIRVITGPNTLLRVPISLAVGRGDTLYVLNSFGMGKYGTSFITVTVYAPRVAGAVEPVRSIIVTGGRHSSGGGLGLIWPTGIAVDDRGAVYLANYWSHGVVAVFAPGANGPVRPQRLVYPRWADTTKDSRDLGAVGVAIGPADELFVAASPQPAGFTMR